MYRCLVSTRVKKLVALLLLFLILEAFGIFTHLFEKDFNTEFHYPYDGDIKLSVWQLRRSISPDIKPFNFYNYTFLKDCKAKCYLQKDPIRLVYLVKSAPEHFDRRVAIRSSWGYEKRFSDVVIRTVFLIGIRDYQHKLQESINKESQKYNDIVQGDYVDSYYNNTIKTMMGMKWAVEYCSNTKFFMFVDDDFYVSTKNVLRYVRNPTHYPAYVQDDLKSFQNLIALRDIRYIDYELPEDVELYTGYTFNSSPQRHITSKWLVSLDEYPYDKWPRYVTAGAYILSKEALLNLYFASFFTKHFRFDDIYVGLLAHKMNIEPYHSEYFHFYKQPYKASNYNFTVASHGYENPQELLEVWNQQRSLRNA